MERVIGIVLIQQVAKLCSFIIWNGLCMCVRVCDEDNYKRKRNQTVENFVKLKVHMKQKKGTHKIWIQVREERYLRQPSHSWISSVSLGEFAMASHSCYTPFECFCFLSGETVTTAQITLLCKILSINTGQTSLSVYMYVYIMHACVRAYWPGELCAHSAAEPERALCNLPGLSCLVCRWSMRKGIGWSGVSVINLVINSYRSRVKQKAVRPKWYYKGKEIEWSVEKPPSWSRDNQSLQAA